MLGVGGRLGPLVLSPSLRHPAPVVHHRWGGLLLLNSARYPVVSHGLGGTHTSTSTFCCCSSFCLTRTAHSVHLLSSIFVLLSCSSLSCSSHVLTISPVFSSPPSVHAASAQFCLHADPVRYDCARSPRLSRGIPSRASVVGRVAPTSVAELPRTP